MIKAQSYRDVFVLSVTARELTSLEQVAVFTRQLRAFIPERTERNWLVDFGDTTFFITPAVNTLLEILRTLRDRGGQLVLTGISADVLYILGLMRVDGVLTIQGTLAAGLRLLGVEADELPLAEPA